MKSWLYPFFWLLLESDRYQYRHDSFRIGRYCNAVSHTFDGPAADLSLSHILLIQKLWLYRTFLGCDTEISLIEKDDGGIIFIDPTVQTLFHLTEELITGSELGDIWTGLNVGSLFLLFCCHTFCVLLFVFCYVWMRSSINSQHVFWVPKSILFFTL